MWLCGYPLEQECNAINKCWKFWKIPSESLSYFFILYTLLRLESIFWRWWSYLGQSDIYLVMFITKKVRKGRCSFRGVLQNIIFLKKIWCHQHRSNTGSDKYWLRPNKNVHCSPTFLLRPLNLSNISMKRTLLVNLAVVVVASARTFTVRFLFAWSVGWLKVGLGLQ